MNVFQTQPQDKTEQGLKARCQSLIDRGDRVAAVKLYRTETGASLAAAMQALDLKQGPPGK